MDFLNRWRKRFDKIQHSLSKLKTGKQSKGGRLQNQMYSNRSSYKKEPPNCFQSNLPTYARMILKHRSDHVALLPSVPTWDRRVLQRKSCVLPTNPSSSCFALFLPLTSFLTLPTIAPHFIHTKQNSAMFHISLLQL